jgi:hypothetical protein
MERRALLTAMALAVVAAVGAYALLATVHIDVQMKVVGFDGGELDLPWFGPALTVFIVVVVVGGGVGTLAWWAYRFVRARLTRRGPWS